MGPRLETENASQASSSAIMASPTSPDALTTLCKTIVSTKTLALRFEAAIQNPTPDALLNIPPNPPNPLALLADGARILKAQTTKLSLLVLNQPFTPSETTYILKELCKGCLPAMMTAAEICPADKYTNYLHRLIRASVGSSMLVLIKLLGEIPVDGHSVRDSERGTLQYTGQLWESCDFMINLAEKGLTSYAAVKVTEYKELVDDALEELEEWVTEVPDDGEDSFGVPGILVPHMNDTDRACVKNVVKKLKLIGLLYPPLLKRRIRRFPEINGSTSPEQLPSSKQVGDMDTLIAYMQLFHEEMDSIAETLYTSGMGKEADIRIGVIIDYAKKALAIIAQNWNGENDEFTAWSEKWLVKIKEP
ncbi:MAG: hypothetical protein FRX48_03838 [Lasallia pustulata]|uniref:Cyclin-D1-binding protein 1-like N-terminal domain-containing protein n=1 Tax=Lasallia pustulata TaxID=136370 RepID=A0A5M8PV38_9LECA|nr:MAG: hypothetical protein FRX48_03838 [Lasallia pustulata]